MKTIDRIKKENPRYVIIPSDFEMILLKEIDRLHYRINQLHRAIVLADVDKLDLPSAYNNDDGQDFSGN
jgi:hypothetical protein